MPAVMETTLFLLFFGGFWAQEINAGSPEMTTPGASNFSFSVSEAPGLHSVTFSHPITRVPKQDDSTGRQLSLRRSTPYTAGDASSPEPPIAVSGGVPVSGPVISHEVSTEKSSMPQEISNATSNPTVTAGTTLVLDPVADGTMATSSLEHSSATGSPPVTMATTSADTSSGTIGPSVTMTASSEKNSSGTIGTPVTMTTSSEKNSSGTIGTPVTMTTSSEKNSSGTIRPPVTMTTSSLETSSGTREPPVVTATSSPETSKGSSGSPTSGAETGVLTTSATSANTGSRQAGTGALLVVLLVALPLVVVILALWLWHQRQKRRTGVLTLHGGGKHNGVVDAWAGPAQVADEEAVMTTGVSGGDKDPAAPEAEGFGRRPTLTTFFGRRKSRQASLALEELKAGSDPSMKGEEEPLVGGTDGAVETPTSDGPEAGGEEAP